MSSSLAESFLGALQASLSVLLVIFYGVLAAQFKLLDSKSGKDISKVCVRMFLPMLLITKIGSQLHLETAVRYLPILAWSLVYNLLSIAVGLVATKLTGLPGWVTPAVAFNNTTSLPLLLIQSLTSTGILDRLIIHDEPLEEVIERAKSYFLVCAIVGNCLTFAIGPRLIDAEHAPEADEKEEDDPDDEEQGEHAEHENGVVGQANSQEEEPSDELTSLLPTFIYNIEVGTERRAYRIGKKRWDKLKPRTQHVLLFCYDFLNAPLIGAVIGCIVGLVPGLHTAFFAGTEEGGFLHAWLTSSLSNVGQLFVSLQVVVVGVSLSSSLRKMKRGEESGHVPVPATIFVLVTRFILWPVISITVIWALASKTRLLGDDPILWFAMMLMPTGPPAMKLMAMADVNGAEESEKMSIAKLLTISYAFSPFLAFTVVGALHASAAAMGP